MVTKRHEDDEKVRFDIFRLVGEKDAERNWKQSCKVDGNSVDEPRATRCLTRIVVYTEVEDARCDKLATVVFERRPSQVLST